jgi:putative transposase
MPECSTKNARRDAFDYIEIFYTPKLRGYNSRLPPVDYEKQYFERIASI